MGTKVTHMGVVSDEVRTAIYALMKCKLSDILFNFPTPPDHLQTVGGSGALVFVLLHSWVQAQHN